MHGFYFTTDVRHVLSQAREEAARLNNPSVDTEHIALAFTRGATGAKVLRDIEVDLEAFRDTAEQAIHPTPAPPPKGDLPYSSHAKKTLEHALKEAAEHGHDFVGVDHLLIGVIQEEGLGSQLLTRHGATADRVRAHLLAEHPENPARMPRPDGKRRFFGLF